MRKKIFSVITGIVVTLFLIPVPAFARGCSSEQLEAGCVNTNVLGEDGCSCKPGETAENGNGIFHILFLAVEILSVGVGVLGVIGISVVGIQYLTAGGNEEKTRKSKRRMFEIILGLVAYAVIYALLKFLLPNFQGVG